MAEAAACSNGGDGSRPATAAEELAAARAELKELKSDFVALRRAVRTRVDRELHTAKISAKTVRSFLVKSLATIIGWFTAETFNNFLIRAFEEVIDKPEVSSFIARSVYASSVSLIVPLALWRLSGIKPQPGESITIKRTQVEITRASLPALVAWAWNDWSKDAVVLMGDEVWSQVVVAVVLTLVVSISEWAPCYGQAMAAIKGNETTAGLVAQFEVLPKYLALAVGYAWNSLCRLPVAWFQDSLKAPLFIFMVQVVYFILITTFISVMQLLWDRRQKRLKREAEEEAANQGNDDAEQPRPCLVSRSSWQIASCTSLAVVETAIFEVVDMGGKIMMDSMHFVYAWAVLDTINALFFTFLLGCEGPGTCGYPSNFAFALCLTVLFSWASSVLSVEKRKQEWNIAAANLLMNSFSLCVGWAWANFCKAAIQNAEDINMVALHRAWVIGLAFVWLAASAFYHRYMVEQHAWERNFQEDSVGHGIDNALHIKESEQKFQI